MWITQSYLANVEPNAEVFVYYLYESYKPDQVCYTKSLEESLAKFGDIYGYKVALLLPNKKYTIDINNELVGIPELWSQLSGSLPGILISKQPLSQFNNKDFNAIVIPLNSDSVEVGSEKYKLIYNEINKMIKSNQPNLLSKLVDSLILTPNISGLGIDIKKLFRK